MSRRRYVVALLAALALVLSACGGGSDQGTPAGAADDGGDGSGGVLRIAMSAGNVPFPATSPNEGYEGFRFVGNNIYDGLTRLNLHQSDELPTPQPSLAESWEVSDDLTTWTFKLREDVTFHDGTPFNADAVVFQWDRVSKQDSEFYSVADSAFSGLWFRYVASYQKIDDFTVEVTTTQPYAWLDYDMLHVYYPSPEIVRTIGNEDYNQHATGTGPFTMTKYIDGEVMELTANEDYWGGRPKLDQIVLYPQPEPASRLAALQASEVNWSEVPSPDAIDQLEAEGYQVFMGEHPGAIMPMLNQFRPPLDDVKVRQALNYAIDREGTVALINDTGAPANQYVYPGHPHYVEDHEGYGYDPEKAEQLLAEAGYEPGDLKLKFAYTTGGSGNMYPGTMMEKIQGDFRAIGVDVELVPMEWNSLITIIIEGLAKPEHADIDILWSSPAAGMVPTGYAFSHLCEFAAGAPNATGYCNPAADEAYETAAKSATVEDQNHYLQEMNRVTLDDAAFLFWVYDRNLRVLSPDVHGYVHPQSWWVDFTTIWVEG